MFDENSHSRY